MVQYRSYLWATLSLSLLSFSSAYAAEALSLHNTPFSELKQTFQASLPGLAPTGHPMSDSLHILQQHTDKHHRTHVRMQQYYAGFPVFGGYAILHGVDSVQGLWSSKKSPGSMNGVVYKGLAEDLDQPPADFVKQGDDALAYFKSKFSNENATPGTVHPMVYIDSNHQAHWVYQVSVLILQAAGIPKRPTAIIDAKTHELLAQWNDIKTARSSVSGRGFSGNKHVGLHQFGEDLPLLSLTRSDVTGMCYMENTHVKVVNMMHHYEGRNQTMHFKCDDSGRQSDNSYFTGYKGNGYDRINGAFSPSNDALYVGGVIYGMYKKWYGVYPLEANGRAKKLLMRVHFGIQYDNAFWDGEQMTFGDGGLNFYPLVSIGVGAHEISHGFTEQHSDLAYFGQSGGMNESFSDMAAQAAEYYATGTNDWQIGAEIVKEDSQMTAFRFMDHPSRDGRSIDDASQYTVEMDVHHSSGVYNRLFYLLATTPNWTVRKAFEVMLTANADYWTPTSTFDEGACGIIDAAKSLDYSLSDVKQALIQVGVHYADCYDDHND